VRLQEEACGGLCYNDLFMHKETCTCEMRPTQDVNMHKETCKCKKRPVNVKRDLYT